MLVAGPFQVEVATAIAAAAVAEPAGHVEDPAMSPALLDAEDACVGTDAEGEACSLSALQLRASGAVQLRANASQSHAPHGDYPKCCVCSSGGVVWSEGSGCDDACRHKGGAHTEFAPPRGCDAEAVREQKLKKFCGRACFEESLKKGGQRGHGETCTDEEAGAFPEATGEPHVLFVAASSKEKDKPRWIAEFLDNQAWFLKRGMKESSIHIINGQYTSREDGFKQKYDGKYRPEDYSAFKGQGWPADRTTFCHKKSPLLQDCWNALKDYVVESVPSNSPLLVMYLGHGSESGRSTLGGYSVSASTWIALLTKRKHAPTLLVVTTCYSGMMVKGLIKRAAGDPEGDTRALAVLSSSTEMSKTGTSLLRMLVPALEEMQKDGEAEATFLDFAHFWHDERQAKYNGMDWHQRANLVASSKDMWCYRLRNFCLLGSCR